jgi:D-aspartate ligase
MTPDVSTPVVIFRSESYCALGIVRSLGRMGVKVYGIDSDPDAYGLKSRYCAGRFSFDFDRAEASEAYEFLCRVADQVGGRPVLIPTFDTRNLFLEKYAEQLSERYVFARQPPGVTSRLYSKRSMYHLCKELGVPTAETLFPATREEVVQFLDKVQFPLVLKAIDGDRLQRRAGVSLVIARDAKELLEAFDRIDEPGHPNLMLQEYIPGEDDTIWMFNGYFNQASDCLFGITGKKIRQHPIHTGMTSLGICLPNEMVHANTLKIAKAVGYRGIIDIGHRYDRRDGGYKVLDINPRIGATFRLFVDRHGTDVIRALYLDLTGQSVPQAAPDWGRKWMVEDKDIVSCWHYRREGTLRFLPWLRSYRGVKESAYFAWDDLRPSLSFVGSFLVKLVGGAWRSLARTLGLLPPLKAAALPGRAIGPERP